MKKTILLSSILAVGAAFAEAPGTDVECDNLIGALDVTISTTRAQTLVSVPFLGYNGGAVKVEEMVKTSNLGVNSKLYVANENGGYDTWKLNSDNTWEPDAKVTIGTDGVPVVGESAPQSDATANRGDAFWIEPANGSTGKIYLLGQGVTTAGSSAVSEGWNLVGNTSAEAKTISGEGYKKGEKICVQLNDAKGSLDSYTFKVNVGWVKIGDREASTVTIEPGQGFWFLSKGTETIAW